MSLHNPFSDIYQSGPYRQPYEHKKAGFPLLIDVEATNHCNLDCVMCARQVMKRPKGRMSLGMLKKIADEASTEGCRGIRFIRYGEPLLNESIFDMVSYAKGKGLLAHMTTNGLLLNEEKSQRVLDSGLDSIIFSFQGTDKKGYEAMRNNKNYDLLERNIRALAEKRKQAGLKRPFIQVTTTVLDETEAQVKGFYDKWNGVADRVDHWYTSLEWLEGVERAKPLFERQQVREKLEKWEEKSGRNWRCNEVMVKLSVNWDGSVTACCGDFDNFLKVGRLDESSLKEIWHGKKMEGLREILGKGERGKIPFCSKCTSKF